MPKKSRRAKAKHRARVVREVRREYSQPPKPVRAESQLSAKISPEPQSLTNRYQYLMPELRRIGILAGAIIMALIILSLVLG
jgi:hypothetical protein